jgi:hypothetical protein
MSETARDPRIDPQPGDELTIRYELAGVACRDVYRVEKVNAFDVWYFRVDIQSRERMRMCSWRERMKVAEI